MRVAMIGTGYVGLVSGTCFAEFGLDVVCVDIDEAKINCLKQGDIPIYEPGLKELAAKHSATGRLSFTTNLEEGVKNADAIFIAVGTPPHPETGHADLKYVFAAARQIATAMTGYTVIVDKSTVPVGTARRVAEVIRDANLDADFDVVSNPEFLREGAAIEDFSKPDRVVVGAESARAIEVMREIYKYISDQGYPVMFTGLETAEIIKYAANAFLATKITFINELADLCEKANGNVVDVATGIGMDSRIGGKFLQPGPGYGGSCFPKDTLALLKTAEQFGSKTQIVETVVKANNDRKQNMAAKVAEACGGSLSGKRVAVLGFTFKAETDDMRDSPSLDIVPALQKRGAHIVGFDPQGMKEAKPMFELVEWADNSYAALEGADVALIITEWKEFAELDLVKVKNALTSPTVVDLRNLYDPEVMADAGIDYYSVGRPRA